MLGEHPLGSLPLGGITDAQAAQITETTLRYASRTFSTRATDAPAHTDIDGRIAGGLRLGRSLTEAEGGQFGGMIRVQFGEIELNNEDGRLDDLVTRYAADGRTIRLKIGATEIDSVGRERVKPLNSFALVYTSIAGPWTFQRDRVRLKIESLNNRLQGRLQQQVYAGTGGQNGTADIAGRTRPLAFGLCKNITLQLVDPAILTYQAHSGAMESVQNVYDAGVALPFDADYPTYASLASATITAATYATCLAEGYVRLGSIPAGAVTADVRGHIDQVSGNYVSVPASVIRTILRDFAGFTSSEFDAASFVAAQSVQPGAIGIFFPTGDTSTIAEVLERIAFAAGFFVGQDRSGLYRIQRLEPPGTTVHWSLNARNILENGFERLPLPYGVPWSSWGVGYDVNWTVQADADLATSVTQARRQFLKAERRYAFSSNAAIATRHKSSSGAPFRESFFTDAVVAQAEADRLIDLYGLGRAMYRVTAKTLLFSVEIGQTVRISDSRFGLSGGKNFTVVGVEDDADRRETTLTVFG